MPATEEFLQAAREACDRHQALLIFDEVQTGMGRTGKLFAHQYYDVQPDIVSSAKALGCGIPIGAMLTTAHIGNSFTPGSHGSTFGGNPLACAVGCAAFDIINTPETMQNVLQQGKKLQAGLQELAESTGVFSQVRGQGLLLGCVMSEAYSGKAAQLMQLALQHGLLVLVAGNNVLRLAPSLLLSDADLQAGLQRLKAAITAFIHI